MQPCASSPLSLLNDPRSMSMFGSGATYTACQEKKLAIVESILKDSCLLKDPIRTAFLENKVKPTLFPLTTAAPTAIPVSALYSGFMGHPTTSAGLVSAITNAPRSRLKLPPSAITRIESAVAVAGSPYTPNSMTPTATLPRYPSLLGSHDATPMPFATQRSVSSSTVTPGDSTTHVDAIVTVDQIDSQKDHIVDSHPLQHKWSLDCVENGVSQQIDTFQTVEGFAQCFNSSKQPQYLSPSLMKNGETQQLYKTNFVTTSEARLMTTLALQTVDVDKRWQDLVLAVIGNTLMHDQIIRGLEATITETGLKICGWLQKDASAKATNAVVEELSNVLGIEARSNWTRKSRKKL